MQHLIFSGFPVKKLSRFLKRRLFPILLFTLSGFSAHANMSIELTADKSEIRPGDNLNIQVIVSDAPPVYGADIAISYDSRILAPTQQTTKNDFQLPEPGAFFDKSKSFFIRNKINDNKGLVEYTVALMNPAPPSEGRGAIFSIQFTVLNSVDEQSNQTGRSLTDSPDAKSIIFIDSAKFGTRKGDTLIAQINEPLQFTQILESTGKSMQDNSAGSESKELFVQTLMVIAGAIILGVFLFRKKISKIMNNRIES